jgi:hypothetical protein
MLALPAGASADVRFWVSPDGADANPGTKAAPFATLDRAKRAVRHALDDGPRTRIEVVLRGGTYRLDEPLTPP